MVPLWLFFSVATAPGQSFSLGTSELEVSVTPEFNHLPIRVAVISQDPAFDISSVTVSSDANWVGAVVDGSRTELVLSFATTNLLNESYTAAVTATHGSETRSLTVTARVAPLDICALKDDPKRGRTYGLQRNGAQRGAVIILNRNTGEPLGCVTAGRRPCAFAISEDARELLVLNKEESSISVLDLKNLALKSETIGLIPPIATANPYGFSPHLELGPQNTILYTDGGSPSALYVLSRASGLVIQTNIPTEVSAPEPTSIGRFAMTPDRSYVFGWGNMAWSTHATVIAYRVNIDGTLQLQTVFGRYDAYIMRSPVDTPILATRDSRTVFLKNALFAADSVWDIHHRFPGPVYAITPDGEVAATATALYETKTRLKLADLPVNASVQSISPDAQYLTAFDSNTRVITRLKLSDLLPSGLLNDSTPTDGAIVVTPKTLEWRKITGTAKYNVYLGTSLSEVQTASTGSALFLGQVDVTAITMTDRLVPGTDYYWRVDGVTEFDVIKGDVRHFRVEEISLSASALKAVTVQGHKYHRTSIKVGSETAGLEWGAEADAPWVRFEEGNGLTPGVVNVLLDASMVLSGTHDATITIHTGSSSTRIPVNLTVDPLRVMVIKADARSGFAYALSENNSGVNGNAYLLEINALTETITRATPVGPSASDFAIHHEDGCLYVSDAQAGIISAVDIATLEPVRSYPLGPISSAGPRYIHRLSAGKKGRLILREYDQWIKISLFDTSSGFILTDTQAYEGEGVSDSSGRTYYHSENRSFADLRKFDLSQESFKVVATAPATAMSVFPGAVVLSDDGSRVFWRGGVFDADLRLLWNIGEQIFAASGDGRFAFGATNVWDVTTRLKVPVQVPATAIKTFHTGSEKLIVSYTNSVGFVPFKEGPREPVVKAVVPGVTNLVWPRNPIGTLYHIFVGQSAAEVATANTNSPAYLGSATTNTFALRQPLAAGAYFWRTDALTPFGLVTGAVHEFTVSTIFTDKQTVRAVAFANHTTSALIDLRSISPGEEWSASSDTPWVGLRQTNGTTPATLELVLTGNDLPGDYGGTVTIRSASGSLFTIQIALLVEPLRLTRIQSDPLSPRVYAVSEDTSSAEPLAYLLEIDSLSERISRAVAVGSSVNNLVWHPAEKRIYVSNYRTGSLLAIDAGDLSVVRNYPFGSSESWENNLYGLAAGTPGRLLVQSASGQISILDTESGVTMPSPYAGKRGLGWSSRTGRYYFHGDEPSWTGQGVTLRKFDVAGDQLTQVATYQSSSGFANTPVLVSSDDATVIWNGAVFDNALRLVWDIGQPIYAVSANGRFAYGISNVWDLASRTMHSVALPATELKAFNAVTEKLVFDQTNSIGFLPTRGANSLNPPAGAIIADARKLEWTPWAFAHTYDVYYGKSREAVVEAKPGSAVWAGSVTTNSWSFAAVLPAGTYFWRVDAVTDFGAIPGDVVMFTVSPIQPDRTEIATAGFGNIPLRCPVALTSPRAGEVWRATASEPWIVLQTTNGSTPATLEVRLLPGLAGSSLVNGSIEIEGESGFLFTIPVRLAIEPLRITMMKADPRRPRVYAVNEDVTNARPRAYLLELNTLTETLENVTEVGWSVTDLAVHPGDDRIYVANWKPGLLRALDRTSLAEVQSYRFIAGAYYESADLSRISAGVRGRLLVEGSTSYCWIYDTAGGSFLTNRYFRSGSRGVTDSSGRFYYRGEGSVPPVLRKYDLLGDQIAEIKQAPLHGADPYYMPSAEQLISADDGTVVWSGGVFDSGLNLRWNIGQRVLAISSDGRYAIGSSNVWDVDSLSASATVPPASIKAFDWISDKLVFAQTNTVHFLKMGFERGFSPAAAAIVADVQQLEWRELPGATGYSVYLGADEESVRVGDTNSLSFLGVVTGNSIPIGRVLTPGVYYWKADARCALGSIPGDVHRFIVSPVVPGTHRIDAVTFPEVPGKASLELLAAAGAEWSLSTDSSWLQASPTSGSGSQTVSLSLQPGSSSPTNMLGAISVRGAIGELFTIPVNLTVETLNVTMMRSDPASANVYAISENTNAPDSRAYLLEVDTAAEIISRVQPVGSAVTDLALHPAEGRIYIASSRTGLLRALDRATLRQESVHSFMPEGSSAYGVFHVAAGQPGRVVIDSKRGTLSLLDTDSGRVLTNRFNTSFGDGKSDPLGSFYYRGDYDYRTLSKFQLSPSDLNQVAYVTVPQSYPAGRPRALVLSPDGEHVFWNRALYDTNLVEQWRIGDEIYGVSADGRFAFSNTNIYDLEKRFGMLGPPANTTALSHNGASRKLIAQVGNTLTFYPFDPIAGLAFSTPLLSTGPVFHANIVLRWTDRSLEQSFTIQQRVTGSEIWTNLPPIPGNVVEYSIGGLAGGTSYEFRVRAESVLTNSPWSEPLIVRTPVAPPPAPIMSFAVASTAVLVRWSAPVPFEQVLLQRSLTNSLNWTDLALIPGTSKAFEDTAVISSVPHFYRIKGLNSTNESAFSVASIVVVPSPAPPGIPQGVACRSVATNLLILNWNDVLGETGYVIERRTEATAWQHLTSARTNEVSFSDTNVVEGVEYSYRVAATNAFGMSGHSAIVTAVPRNIVCLVADDFDPALDAMAWAVIGSAEAINGGKGFLDGNALWFGGTGDRVATTIPVPLSFQGYLEFKLRAGNEAFDGTNFWNNSEAGEDVVLEYSIGNEVWVPLQTINTSYPGLPSWTSFDVSIPSAALSPRTQFRWRQVRHSGPGSDTWALEDVKIYSVVPQPPLPPELIIASANSSTSVAIYWSASTRATFYVVERAIRSQTWSTLATVSATYNYFTDTNATPNTEYTYRVKAANFGGHSPFSTVAYVTTLTQQRDWLLQNAAVVGAIDEAALHRSGPDGIPFVLKYAFNLCADEPWSPYIPGTGGGKPAIWLDEWRGFLCVEFVGRRLSGHPGVQYIVQFSHDTQFWTTAEESSRVALDSVWERVTVTDQVTGANARFARVLVIVAQ